MSKKYKFSLSVIGFFMICSLSLLVLYSVREKNRDIAYQVMRSENLSINFFGDNSISTKNKAELKFSVSNNTDKEVFYTINAVDIKNFNSSVKVHLESDNNTFVVLDTDKNEKKLLDNNQLLPYQTVNYVLKVDNKSEEHFSFDVMVNEVKNNEDTFAKNILKNNELKNPLTTIATDIADADEGLISDIDEYGPTYYFRGDVKNNYVSFANLTWRIVRINGDGTVRLVLDKNIESVHNYLSDNSNISYESSSLKTFLDDWYKIELESYNSMIAIGKFCNDNNIIEGSEFYNSYTRIVTNNIPAFSCLGDKVGAMLGLLTVDEIVYAGANNKKSNSSFYLYNKDSSSFWTMSGGRLKNNVYYPFVLNESGKLVTDINSSLNRGIRPVINIKSTVYSTGDGTIDNPYVITEEK